MNLDEAIRHCLETASNHETCKEEHLQLAEWLIELKVRRTIQVYYIQPPMGIPFPTSIPYESIA